MINMTWQRGNKAIILGRIKIYQTRGMKMIICGCFRKGYGLMIIMSSGQLAWPESPFSTWQKIVRTFLNILSDKSTHLKTCL